MRCQSAGRCKEPLPAVPVLPLFSCRESRRRLLPDEVAALLRAKDLWVNKHSLQAVKLCTECYMSSNVCTHQRVAKVVLLAAMSGLPRWKAI